MSKADTQFQQDVSRIRRRDGRYAPDAYTFVLEGLNDTVERLGERRHVTGPELLDGIRACALHRFGLMASTVFASWGIESTDDFGEIVFNMIDQGLMGKTDRDRREDFHNVYRFREALDRAYRVEGRWAIPSSNGS